MQPIYKRTFISIGIALGLTMVSVLYFSYNPSQHSFFLPCPFKFATSYNCPGCGSQRAIHQLLHGDLVSAFRFNPLMVLSLPLIIYGFGAKVYNYIFEASHRVRIFYSPIFIYGYFGIAIIYWVVRNINSYPFNLLAPTEIP